ncbi:MAG: FtsQ-type POTRA domain-containing protein, partial [Deferribacteraceae bacterium]|jgi:hypothetical protein|nr:FtsQ-type POTRA domain-containing protein [Deferribacteraceae bacterium]
VEVRGVRHTDADKLKALYAPMVGQNLFREVTSAELMSDDPWIQRLEIRRSLPSTLVVMVKEERELLSYRSGEACMSMTESAKHIERDCNGVSINVVQTPLAAEFRNFVYMYNSMPELKAGELTLKNGFFTLREGNTTFVSTYEPAAFADNYKAYVEKIRPRYKRVDSVDMTVRGKVYVKGVRNG